MRTKTPIFECTLNPIILLKHNGKLTLQKTEIILINGQKIDDKIRVPLDPNIKLLLDDFITLPRLPKSIFISYIYIILGGGGNTYICYDAISVKDGQDNKETLTPALFVKNTKINSFINKDLKKIFKIIKCRSTQLSESCHVHLDLKKILEHQLNQLLQSGHVHLNVDFEKIDLNYKDNGKQGYKFIIHQKIKFFRYPWGEGIKVFPVPKLPKPGNAPKHGQTFGIDGDGCNEIWDSIEKLNSILRIPGNKKVFIQGEPGSGKEVFAHAIHYGSASSKPNNFVIRAVAGADTQELRKLLFGRTVDGVSLPGLIKKANGGTLFLDEFDKINKDFYPELLRVLEAEEYVSVDGKEILKVGKVNWIFAGAFMGTAVSNAKSDLPQDFWSRLTSYIMIENPIQFQLLKDKDSPSQSEDYIISKDFFCKPRKRYSKYSYAQIVFLYFFLQEAVEKGRGVDNITTDNEGDFRSGIIRILFIECYFGLLQPSWQLLKFADDFNKKINGGIYLNPIDSLLKPNRKKDLLDSVRSIRQAAKVAFSKCYYSALKAENPANFWDKQKDDRDKALEEAVKSVKNARKSEKN